MKTYFFILLIALSFLESRAQEAENILLYDEKGEQINQDEFNKALQTNKYTFIKHPSEFELQFQLILKNRKGKIGMNEWMTMNAYLQSNTTEDVFNVIVYYFGGEYCHEGSDPVLSNSQKRKIRRQAGETKFNYLYFDDESNPLPKEYKIDWDKDYTQFFKQNFLSYFHPCSNLLLVDYNGNYIAVYGEFDDSELVDYVNELVDARR